MEGKRLQQLVIPEAAKGGACKLTHVSIEQVTHGEVHLQAEVERLEQLVDAEAARGDYILEAAEDNIDGFAQALEQQAQRQQRSRQAELQRQRQGLTRAAAQELVQERRQRMTALKEVICEPCACCFCFLCGVGGQRGRGRWGMPCIVYVQERCQRVAALRGASALLYLLFCILLWGGHGRVGEKEGWGEGAHAREERGCSWVKSRSSAKT